MSDDIKFNEQSFLLDFFTEIVTRNANASGDYYDYSNFIQIEGDSVGLMNRLLVRGNPNALWNLTTSQISMLVPKVSIFKISKDQDGNQVQRQFRFNEFTSVEDIMKSKRKRGSDAMLHSFTWNDLGSSPGDTGLSFEANMKLGFQSFDGLFKERGGDLRFSDLLIPAKMNKKDKRTVQREIDNKLLSDGDTRKIDPTDFQIKAVVGWSLPSDPGNMIFKDNFNTEEVLSTQVALLLTLTSHDIDIREDGRVDISINYMAALEGRAMSPKQDLLKVEGDSFDITFRNLTETRRRLKSQTRREERNLKKSTKDGAALDEDRRLVELKKEKVKEIETEINKLKRNRRQEAYGRLLNQIEGTGICQAKERRIFFVELTKDQIEVYNEMNAQTFSEIEDVETRKASIVDYRRKRKAEIKSISRKKNELAVGRNSAGGTSSILTELNNKLAQLSPDERKEAIKDWKKESKNDIDSLESPLVINYFYFGDLMEAALQILKDNPATKNIIEDNPLDTGFIMGTINLYNPDSDSMVSVPLCDIPISLNVFQSWFVKTIIEPNTTTLPFLSFLRRAVSQLITGALSPNHFGGANKKANKTKLSLSSFLAHKRAITNSSQKSGRISTSSIGKEVSQSAVSADLSNLIQYNFVFVGGELSKRLSGNESKDKEIGIYHAFVGKDRGLIKNIKFQRTDLPFQREARILGSKNSTDSNLLFSDHYNAEITMVGNAIFKPGMLLYINPTGLGLDPVAKNTKTIQGSWSSKLGIGGYYLITKVENIIEPGKYETLLSLVSEAPIYKARNIEVFSKKAQTVTVEDKSPPNPKRSISDPLSGVRSIRVGTKV